MKKIKRRIHLIVKRKLNSGIKNNHKGKKQMVQDKPRKFEIRKENVIKFEPLTNYFNEYWSMYNENEYILAKIKETVYEINAMKAHIQEVQTFNQEGDLNYNINNSN